MKFQHIYPYSENKDERIHQIWTNLNNGILFEETNTFLPWSLAYEQIEKFKEQQKNSGDRTVWFLGKQNILNGIQSYVTVLKWSFQPITSSFDQVEEFLGFDNEGYDRMQQNRNHLTELLGNPSHIKLEKINNCEVGEIIWENKIARISLIGYEHFALRYSMKIGLINNSHDRDLKSSNDIVAKRMKVAIGFMKNK